MVEKFLEKHQIDVGKTFAIIIFVTMVDEISSSIGALMGGSGYAINFWIVILYFLGVGMWKHSEPSRWWCLCLLYLSAGAAAVMVCLIAFTESVTIRFGRYEEENPPLWKGIVVFMTAAPFIYVMITVLKSKRAKKEFGVSIEDQLENPNDAP